MPCDWDTSPSYVPPKRRRPIQRRMSHALRVILVAGPKPDIVTFNIAIKACRAAPGTKLPREALDAAFGLLAQMQAAGVEADATTYTSLFSLCTQAGAGQRAWDTFQVGLETL